MQQLIQYLIDGLLLGGVYALLAAGLALIFGVMKVINFAQGEFMMLGMYAAYFVGTGLGLDPYVAAIPVAIVVGAGGVVVARGLLERIPRGNQDAQLILTLGLSLVLQNLALQVFGSAPKTLVTGYTNSIITVGGVVISHAKLFACLASIVVMACLWVFMRHSWLGRALRATSDDPSAAGAAGISVRQMHSIAFAIGVGLAALAGTLLATFHSVSPTIGQNYVIIMFVAVVLGGLGSIAGAALGALIVGIVASVAVVEIPLELQDVLVFVLFVLILLLRPQGIFGHGVRV